MFHGLPSCDFLFQLYMQIEQPQCHSVRDGHTRENIDKFATKGEGKSLESVRYSDGSVAHRLKSERSSLKWIDNLRLEK
jgi:hypothetical protein